MLSMDSSKWTSFSKHVAPLYEIKPSHQFIRKNGLRVQNHSRVNLPYNLEGGGLWGPMCLSCSSLAKLLSTMETHISSSQAQNPLRSNMASPTTFADQPKFWIHKSKPYFIAKREKQTIKELSTLGHVYTQKTIRPWLLRILGISHWLRVS